MSTDIPYFEGRLEPTMHVASVARALKLDGGPARWRGLCSCGWVSAGSPTQHQSKALANANNHAKAKS